ncbi:hypothetical protein L195_g061440 [Trifolium pratense]|uniref:Reverse transcriptase domain-containing protein n=2 Tax=Trifolium pratense TaxID=57577 RepID=A0A2K3K9Y1_TRIPR|nr:hypothetical protein L195_g061440 [Trifolium pratense]
MEEDANWEPLLLGRPFLATSRALIDVELGELMLRTEDQKIVFNVFETMKSYEGDPHDVQDNMGDGLVKDECKMDVMKSPWPPGGTPFP